MIIICYAPCAQIIDWYHATQRLWQIAHATYGQGTDQTRQWDAN